MISKGLDVHVSTVKRTVYTWRKFSPVATLPGRGHPVKMAARVRLRMLNEVKKNPEVAAKDLQKSLAHANIFVDKSRISKRLNTMEFMGGHHGGSRFCPKKKKKTQNIAIEHLDVPQHYRQNSLWKLKESYNTMYGENGWKMNSQDY